MTKKDFILIAHTIFLLDVAPSTREMLALDFVDALKRENPRFDMFRFMTAAGFPKYERKHNDHS